MFLDIVLKEVRSNIVSLRMYIALILTLVVFGLGTYAWVGSYRNEKISYDRSQEQKLERIKKTCDISVVYLAQKPFNQDFGPRIDSFISDSREKYFPLRFEYTGFNVALFAPLPGFTNPLTEAFQQLNWMFILAVIVSFTVLLFSFDSISGDKESRTLALALSNPVPRSMILFGKYVSVILSTMILLLPGIILSLVIILVSGSMAFTRVTAMEVVAFMLAATLFIACMASFGMLASVLSQKSNVSLLAALSLWLLFVVVVPNSAIFWAQTVFPIQKMDSVTQKIDMERQNIRDNMPSGWEQDAARYPENRAKMENEMQAAEIKIRHDWYNQMFRQFEHTRLITTLSPVSLFEYLCEAVVSGGYLRFKKDWRDMNTFQVNFLQFIRDLDAKDPESVHQLNPGTLWMYGSRRKADFEQVPIFKEQAALLGERLAHAGLYFLIIVFYTSGAFAVAHLKFLRYDVR